IGQALRVQLHYGVAHVVGTFMGRDWVSRELKRAEAMQYAAAEFIYPDRPVVAVGGKDWAGHAVSDTAGVTALLDELKGFGVPFLQVSHIRPDDSMVPGLSLALLK